MASNSLKDLALLEGWWVCPSCSGPAWDVLCRPEHVVCKECGTAKPAPSDEREG